MQQPHPIPSRKRATHRSFPVALLGLVVASCGGGNSSPPLLEALVIHPDEIDWEAVLEGREVFAEAATEYPFSFYGDAPELDGMLEPQFSYLVPMGTAAYSPVTGRVVRVTEIYSGDFTIQIGAPGQTQPAPVWEVEHVIDVLVEEGDTVVAGQRIATASDASCRVNPTYCEYDLAVIEFGFLTRHGHECPYAPDLVSPAHAAAIDAELDAMFATVRGLGDDPTAYDRSAWETSNCKTLDVVDPR